MAREHINIGTVANDGTGDPIRSSFYKTNNNFIELYSTTNSAFTKANTAESNSFPTVGGTITGNVTVTQNMRSNGQYINTLQILTDGAYVDWNCNLGGKAKLYLTGNNRTINAVTNIIEGGSYSIWIIQDATGSRMVSWANTGNGSYDFGDEGSPVLSTSANTADVIGFDAITIGSNTRMRYVGTKGGYR